jgi:hypothetical protein
LGQAKEHRSDTAFFWVTRWVTHASLSRTAFFWVTRWVTHAELSRTAYLWVTRWVTHAVLEPKSKDQQHRVKHSPQ